MAERPGVLRVGDRVLFGGGEHQVVGLAGNAVRLLAVSGQAAVVALPFLLAAPDFAIVGTGTAAAALGPRLTPHGLLDALPEHVARAARDWERHLIEVLTGVPPDAPDGAAPRPEYDLARPLAEREQAKAAELTAAGVKASARTVRRMRYRYREQGLWGLVDTRHAPAARPAGNVDPRVVAAAAAVIDAQAGTSTGTRGRVIRQVIDRLEAEHGPGVVPVPSRATFYRLLAVLSAGRHTLGGSTGDLADSTVAYSGSVAGPRLARELAVSGGVTDRHKQEVNVVAVDAGDGLAQADGCPVGRGWPCDDDSCAS